MLQATVGDSEYDGLRESAVWNAVLPSRLPDKIVRPSSRDQIAEIVKQAIKEQARISVKSGGHNWLGACLRDSGVLLDLGLLTSVTVDTDSWTAVVEPGATNKILADAIVPQGYGFPIGHCLTVGLGGYLLAGGFGWNPTEWGPACWSVKGLDVVTTNGEELYIDEVNHPDLFWAARGGGPGFPAIASRFHLKLHRLPQICSAAVTYKLAHLCDLLPWPNQVGTPGVEIALIARPAPVGDSGNRDPIVTVAITGFAEDEETARDLVHSTSRAAPFLEQIIDRKPATSRQLNDLEGEGGWTKGLRYAVDTGWVTDGLEEVAAVCADALRDAPSNLTRIVFTRGKARAGGPDVALAHHGSMRVNVYATWTDPSDDSLNQEWLRGLMAALEPSITGLYIGESDLSSGLDRVKMAFGSSRWKRLNEVCRQYDPSHRKWGFLLET